MKSMKKIGIAQCDSLEMLGYPENTVIITTLIMKLDNRKLNVQRHISSGGFL